MDKGVSFPGEREYTFIVILHQAVPFFRHQVEKPGISINDSVERFLNAQVPFYFIKLMMFEVLYHVQQIIIACAKVLNFIFCCKKSMLEQGNN